MMLSESVNSNQFPKRGYLFTNSSFSEILVENEKPSGLNSVPNTPKIVVKAFSFKG